MFYKTPEGAYRARPFDPFEWLDHGFGTRANPLLDLESVATLRQVHSDRTVDAGARSGCLGEGDALVSNAPGSRLGVKTADCLPILLVDEGHRAVAAVHAGWRGTVTQIVAKAVAEMAARFGTQPRDLHAAIGPGIGACCYQVGPEVAVQFQAMFPERRDLGCQTRVDLLEANRRLLVEAGVRADRVYAAALCTACGSGEFDSFRRDGQRAGRMLAMVGIRMSGPLLNSW
ncbi:MAG: peptidoglycan editing factor PgeF [Candidatus Solibacter usitatus]|nr:peptidoglycan editing factor PgeF [Candidatus Solibacter usitatus]